MASFSDLPQELYIEILSNLDPESLIRCAMTSKSMHDALKSSSSLVYTAQLHLDGLKDCGTSIAYPDLIELLVRRRQAWQSPERREPLTCRTLRDSEAYEFVGGAFTNTSQGTDFLQFIQVPISNGGQGCTVRRPLIGIPVEALGLDPTQDLIVFLEEIGILGDTRTLHVHIRTISANTIHPFAQQSPLRFTVFAKLEHLYGAAPVETATLQIARNTLALFLCSNTEVPILAIWDWTTSELILCYLFRPPLTLGYKFGLLDSTYFFIACPWNYGSIRLFKLVRSHAGAAPAVHLATLHLPLTSPNTFVRRISCDAGPIARHPLPQTSFTINDDDRLHVFTVVYDHCNASRRVNPVTLFLHQRVLATYAHRALTLETPLDVLWEEWGPANTMLAQPFAHYEPNFIRYVHGQRCIFPGGIIGDDNPMQCPPSRYVEILDFSSAAVLTSKGMLPALLPTPKGKPGTLVPSSIVRSEDFSFFLHDVETHLPCVITTLALKQPYDAYMIHADGIVGVKMNRHKDYFLLHMYAAYLKRSS
ncbi:hypothetical protein BJ912DRAFT_1067113 [Pholiota molesta]|nr:hypothetical protein BJ912DRAFT_1067113 [Pholiota molesta]